MYVNSVKSIWEKTDSSYIQATKPVGRTPVSQRLFPKDTIEGDQSHKETPRADDEWENASECSSSVLDFDAIPEEFRPSRRGKGLMKVRASPTEDSKDKTNAEHPQNGRFSNKVPPQGIPTRNSNPSTVQTAARICEKEPLRTGHSEPPQKVVDKISDETGKQKKSGEMFFFSSRSESPPKVTNKSQQGRSEREHSHETSRKLENAQDQNQFKSGFYNSEDSQAAQKFDKHSFFDKNIDDNNFNRNTQPKFQDKNTNNQNRVDEEDNFPKNIPPKFPNKNGNDQDRASVADKGAQRTAPEVTVKKRIEWKNDLCAFKRPENKPKFFYEYTRTTRESVKYVPSQDGDDGVTAMYQDFRKGRDICNNFRPKDFRQYNQRPTNQGFDSTYKAQRNEARHFSCEKSQEAGNKFAENNIIFQSGNGKDPIIIRHEIKVIHVNRPGNRNRRFHQSPQTFRPNKGRNGKMINNDSGGRSGKIGDNDSGGRNGKIINNDSGGRNGKKGDNDSGGRNGKMINNDSGGRNGKIGDNDSKEVTSKTDDKEPRERNGKPINAKTRERSRDMTNAATIGYCGVEIKQNAITETAGLYQKTRKQYVRIPLNLRSPFSKTENPSRAVNTEKWAALIKCGRDISDMIAGSYVSISEFLDNYEQWKDFRSVTMLLFQETEKNLSQSCNRNRRIVEVAGLVGAGCKMVQYVPNPGVSIAAKIIAFLSDVVVKIFSSSDSAKSIGMDDFQLKLSLQRDVDSTSDIYLYGVQCDINFRETCEMIEELHRDVQNGSFREFEETFEAGFLKEMSMLSPKQPTVFYKKLERLYKILNDRQQSEEGKAFCEAFVDWPDALTTISHLHRRFKAENWDSSSVLKPWEDVYNLLQNNQSTVEDVLKKIQDCIVLLMREQNIMERYVMDLQRQC